MVILKLLLLIVRFFTWMLRPINHGLAKAHVHLREATAIQPGTIVEQTEHPDKPKGPWVIDHYSYDADDYHCVKPENYIPGKYNLKHGIKYCYVYEKYLKVIRHA